MSSPNLNVMTLFGSILTYVSGFLFAVQEPFHTQAEVPVTMLQVSFKSWLCFFTVGYKC